MLVSCPVSSTRPLHADDGIEAQEFDGDRRVRRDRHRPARSAAIVRLGSASTSTLRPTLECRLRRDGGDDLVHAKKVGPELLVAERVESEDGASFAQVASRLPGSSRGMRGRILRGHRRGRARSERACMDESHRLLLSMRVAHALKGDNVKTLEPPTSSPRPSRLRADRLTSTRGPRCPTRRSSSGFAPASEPCSRSSCAATIRSCTASCAPS